MGVVDFLRPERCSRFEIGMVQDLLKNRLETLTCDRLRIFFRFPGIGVSGPRIAGVDPRVSDLGGQPVDRARAVCTDRKVRDSVPNRLPKIALNRREIGFGAGEIPAGET